jgi:hypothetical protein
MEKTEKNSISLYSRTRIRVVECGHSSARLSLGKRSFSLSVSTPRPSQRAAQTRKRRKASFLNEANAGQG